MAKVNDLILIFEYEDIRYYYRQLKFKPRQNRAYTIQFWRSKKHNKVQWHKPEMVTKNEFLDDLRLVHQKVGLLQ